MADLRSAAGLKQTSRPTGCHVFSIRSASGGGSADALNAHTKQYVTRKSHKKSRCGCIPCKSKRVKCDETRPLCGRCERTNAQCFYEAGSLSSKKGAKLSNISEGIQGGREVTTTQTNGTVLHVPKQVDHSGPVDRLLRHYDIVTSNGRDTVTCSDMLVGSDAKQYRIKILKLAQEHTYLLHAILSVAALHLDHFNVPGHRVPKLKHLQVALTDFQSAINKPITKNEADAILLTSMMINMQYFSYIDSTDPKDSWVFSGDPGRLFWLQMQMGLLTLIVSTEEFHAESLLLPIWIQASYDADESRGLPADLLQLCGIRPNMSGVEMQNNPYLNVLSLIAPLMLLERGSASLIKLLRCIAGFDKSFYALLQQNDHAAFLLMAYWFGMMCYVDFWWNEKRCLRDCMAICMYLDANGDEVVRSLLEFPAGACEYVMEGVKDHPVRDQEPITEAVGPATLSDVAHCVRARSSGRWSPPPTSGLSEEPNKPTT